MNAYNRLVMKMPHVQTPCLDTLVNVTWVISATATVHVQVMFIKFIVNKKNYDKRKIFK